MALIDQFNVVNKGHCHSAVGLFDHSDQIPKNLDLADVF